MLHALGVNPNECAANRDDHQSAQQDEIFTNIASRRRQLPVDLWKIPIDDLISQVAAETVGAPPAKEILLSSLWRFVGQRGGTATQRSA